MANINRRWRRVMAVGCSHGDLIDTRIAKQVLRFRDDYKPEIRFELGDVIDTAAFRHGAKGTKDETRPIAPDFFAGKRWLQQYEPTHIAWGNHDVRLLEYADHPNAILAHAASTLWNDLTDTAAHLKAKTVPYDIEKGWFDMGGVFWGHGFMYNENAVRDHSEMLGGPVVMAHLHQPQQVEGRIRGAARSFCVGTLGEIEKFSYARRRRATLRWGHGCVFGEISDKEAVLWLASCPKGGQLRFPI